MQRSREGDQRSDRRFLGREKERDRAAHARSENAGLAWLAALHPSVSSLQVVDFAAVSDVGKFPARFADVAKVEAEADNSLFSQLPPQKDQLLAVLIRLHAVAENHGSVGFCRRMMQDAAQGIAIGISKKNSF